jgi:hypothetical protein
MTFTLDAQVAAVLAAAIERSGPPPVLPAGDVASRRVALDAMLGYFNNEAQPAAGKAGIADHRVLAPGGAALLARWYRQPSGGSGAAVLYLHGGGMIVGSVAIFDGPVSRYVARTGVSMLSLEYRLAPEHPHPAPVAGELLASLQGPASRGAACLGGRGPAEGAEGTGQMREVGTGQRSPQQPVELAVEDGGGDAQESGALGGQLHDR